MCTNWFYLINGRIENDDNTRFKKFRFVVWIDNNDLWFHTVDGKTDNDDDWHFVPLKEYLNDYAIPSFTDSINSYEDCTAFYELCNDSIIQWNESWR